MELIEGEISPANIPCQEILDYIMTDHRHGVCAEELQAQFPKIHKRVIVASVQKMHTDWILRRERHQTMRGPRYFYYPTEYAFANWSKREHKLTSKLVEHGDHLGKLAANAAYWKDRKEKEREDGKAK